jgi:vesicle coat complex subunit
LSDKDPKIRSLALKTFGNLPADMVVESILPAIKAGLEDRDSQVVSSAVFGIAKMYATYPEKIQEAKLTSALEALLEHENATVVSNVVSVLLEISGKSAEFDLVIDYETANKLLVAMDDCIE